MRKLRLATVEVMLRKYAGQRLPTIALASLEGGAGRDGGSHPRRDLDYLGTVAWALKALPQRLTVYELRRIAGPRLWPYLQEFAGVLTATLGVPDGGSACPRFAVAEAWVMVDAVHKALENTLLSCKLILAKSTTKDPDRVTNEDALKRFKATIQQVEPLAAEARELRDIIYRGTDLEEDLVALQRDPRMVDLWREGRT